MDEPWDDPRITAFGMLLEAHAAVLTQVGLSTSGLTRLIDRVEQAGYVERAACPTDRRGAEAVLTEEGESVLRSAVPAHVESIEAHLASILGDDLSTLEDLLRRIRGGVGPGECTDV